MKSVKISALLDERDNYQFSLKQSFDDAYIQSKSIFSLVLEEVLNVFIRSILVACLSTGFSWLVLKYGPKLITDFLRFVAWMNYGI